MPCTDTRHCMSDIVVKLHYYNATTCKQNVAKALIPKRSWKRGQFDKNIQSILINIKFIILYDIFFSKIAKKR